MTEATKVSPGCAAHVDELPFVRRSILTVVSGFAGELEPGSRVLDAGAGNAPFRELFAHCDYVTADWPQSVHEGAARSDISASLDQLPVPDARFHAVVSTEVLEHVAHPDTVLAEFSRVLVPGGRLCLTVPFVWPLHEEPFDFYRYTRHGLEHLVTDAGFADVVIQPRSGYLATLAQLAEMTRWLSLSDSGHGGRRARVTLSLVRVLSEGIRWLVLRHGDLGDAVKGVSLPLGYSVRATKPASPG